MKTLKFIAFGIVLFLASTMQAQVSVSIHLGTPPQWGPQGYSEARYYYLPDVEAYYDVRTSRFIYLDGRTWVHRTYLPTRYRNYDLYHGYKVVMNNYHGNTPHQYYKEYKVKYAKGYRGNDQRNIGHRPEIRHENQNVNRSQARPSSTHNKKESNKGNDDGHGKNKKNHK